MSLVTVTNIVYNDLKGFLPLTSLLSRTLNGIHPLVAPENEKERFITYQIGEVPSLTKDGFKDIPVLVRCFSDTYESCCAIADQVTEAYKATDSSYSVGTSKPSYTEDGFLIEQNFNLKIQ